MAFARGVDHLDGDERSIPDLVLPRLNMSTIYTVPDDDLRAHGILAGDLAIIERGQPLKDAAWRWSGSRKP